MADITFFDESAPPFSPEREQERRRPEDDLDTPAIGEPTRRKAFAGASMLDEAEFSRMYRWDAVLGLYWLGLTAATIAAATLMEDSTPVYLLGTRGGPHPGSSVMQDSKLVHQGNFELYRSLFIPYLLGASFRFLLWYFRKTVYRESVVSGSNLIRWADMALGVSWLSVLTMSVNGLTEIGYMLALFAASYGIVWLLGFAETLDPASQHAKCLYTNAGLAAATLMAGLIATHVGSITNKNNGALVGASMWILVLGFAAMVVIAFIIPTWKASGRASAVDIELFWMAFDAGYRTLLGIFVVVIGMVD
jgi:hypothetical protein